MKGSRLFPILRVFRSLTRSAEGQAHCEVLKEHLVNIDSYFLKLTKNDTGIGNDIKHMLSLIIYVRTLQ